MQPVDDQYSLEQNFSPGPNLVDGPVSLSIDSQTPAQFGSADCSYKRDSFDKPVGSITIGGKQTVLYRSDPAPGTPVAESYGEGAIVLAARRCFDIRFFSPTQGELQENHETAMLILSTVTFRF